MRRTISAQLDASAATVFGILDDLGTYPQWLDIVTRSELTESAAGEAGPAWYVTLRAKVGPLARSKRLRMVRVLSDPATHARFERAELDSRSHSPWLLDVHIVGDGPCDVTVELSYEGRLWIAPLGAILGSQAESAVPRLQALVKAWGPAV